eukprot:NODE_101_length_19951_cov_0.932501.p20 type:complete len:120 gc:universal NODE_101_length_19951_cov_0.932501:4807-5166(+)
MENVLQLTSEEKLEYKFHDLSTKTASIRSLIISEFEIFENINFASLVRTDINEINNPIKREQILYSNPLMPCMFSTLQRVVNENTLTVEERRLARKKLRGIIPLSAFANFLANRKIKLI